MVMLERVEPFDASDVLRRLSTHWSDLPSIAGIETNESASVTRIAGGALGLLHVPAPIPAGDLAGPTAVAWHWPEAASAIATHRSHAIVHVGSTDLDVLDVRLMVTKLAAAVLAVAGGIGVYIGDAMLVRSAVDYRRDAAEASRKNLPILSWVGFNVVQEEGALSAYTTGLTGFGLPELEVRRSPRPGGEVLGTLADIANHQLASGRVLRDGDTFGETEFDRTVVKYRSSAFIPDLTVAAFELR
jgi:hypothetical protein